MLLTYSNFKVKENYGYLWINIRAKLPSIERLDIEASQISLFRKFDLNISEFHD